MEQSAPQYRPTARKSSQQDMCKQMLQDFHESIILQILEQVEIYFWFQQNKYRKKIECYSVNWFDFQQNIYRSESLKLLANIIQSDDYVLIKYSIIYLLLANQMAERTFQQQVGNEVASYSQNPALARINMEIVNQLVRECQTQNSRRPPVPQHTASSNESLLAMRARAYQPTKKQIIEEEEEEDYENQSEERVQPRRALGGAEYHGEVRHIQYDIDKFKRIGMNSRKMPIYRLSDLYLAAGKPAEKIFEEKMAPLITVERPRKVRESDEENLNQVLDKWINKQNEDFCERKKDEMTQQELEEIVADMGEKKQNFFLYYQGYEQPVQKYLQPTPVHFSPLNQVNFQAQFLKMLARNRQKYQNIEEFEEQEIAPPIVRDCPLESRLTLQTEKQKPVLWGTVQQTNRKQANLRPGQIFNTTDDLRGSYGTNLTNLILKQNSYINGEVVRGAYNKPIQELQRIEIDLNNPNFYLDKIHSGIMRKEEEFYKQAEQRPVPVNPTTQQKREGGEARGEGSLVSSSRFTGGNPTLQSFKQMSEGQGLRTETVNQTIENLIADKLKKQTKTSLKHSQVANRLIFTKFKLDPKQFQNFHRYCYPFDKVREKLKVQIVRNKGIRPHADYLQLNTQKQQSNVKFTNFKSLSLSHGDFIAVENIEESPLLISNIGMCSKLTLQINSKAVLDALAQENFNLADFDDLEKQREEVKPINKPNIAETCSNWRKVISDALGPNGKVFISDNESLLIGTPEGIGVAVLESNLSCLAVVRQKSNPRDFVLVREGPNWFLRRIDTIYTSGVVEPKMQVFSPDSRQINNFLVNYLKSCVKKAFANNQSVTIQNLRSIFNNINEHNIRRHLKQIGARVQSDNRTFTAPQDREMNFDVSPQEVCQYEKMQNSLYNLQHIAGIQTLRTPDKMKQIISTFFKKNPDDLRKYAIAKMINDELHLTSWYLTESFINAQQGQAKIELEGLGDPTNGHGGYSYIKKPQKERMDKDEQVIEKKPEKKVSGTGADLRRLKTSVVTQMLLERGIKNQDIQHLKRWARVDLLKKFGSGKYLRQERQTKKKKKQSEKRDISAIFNKMLRYLNGLQKLEQVNLNEDEYNRIQYYMNRQQKAWQLRREKFLKRNNPQEIKEADEDEEDE